MPRSVRQLGRGPPASGFHQKLEEIRDETDVGIFFTSSPHLITSSSLQLSLAAPMPIVSVYSNRCDVRQLYPLRFEPILRRYLWGGRRLETVLGKPLAAGNDYAESWEIVDHNHDQSVVSFGPLQGTTLSQLLTQYSTELLGRHAPATQFPLLFKFLDANQNLSVQVHPNDEQARRLVPPDLGKNRSLGGLAC